MKRLISIMLITLGAIAINVSAKDANSTVYLNKNIGFNVEGYKYDQPALPCDVDKKLVELLVKKGNQSGLNMELIETKAKINNGTIPVVLIDIEKLDLGETQSHGGVTKFYLPKIQITAGLLKGKDMQTAKHTCAVASNASDVIILNRPSGAVCTMVQKCLDDLSKDVIGWLKPQIK